MEIITEYFIKLLDDYEVPEGYHDIKVSTSDNIIIIDITSLSELEGINKLIPKFATEYYNLINNLLSLLRHGISNYDFIFENIIIEDTHSNTMGVVGFTNNTHMVIKIKLVRIYLDLQVIPAEIIKIIGEYLRSDIDYLNLLDIIRIYNYPHLINYFTREISYTNDLMSIKLKLTIKDAVPVKQIEKTSNGNIKIEYYTRYGNPIS